MGPAVTLDANVVIGFLQPADAHHEDAAAVFADHATAAKIIAASAYAEVLVHPFGAAADEVVDRFFDDVRIEIVPVDREIARQAARLRAVHRVTLADAMVLATARARRSRLITFDRRLARLA